VAVQYLDQNLAYELGSQYDRRLTGGSQEVATLDLPMVMDATEAAQVAQMVLYERWVSRNSQDISLPRKYADLEPTDVITVQTDAAEFLLRIMEKTETGGLVKIKTVTEDVNVYETTAEGVEGPDPVEEVAYAGPTLLRLLDIPLVDDADDGTGLYAAVSGYFSGWPGAELWVSRDNGTTFVSTATAFTTAATVGSATTVLANFSGGNIFDEGNSVTVLLTSGSLSSATEEEVRAGANTAYLAGEPLRFKYATLVATNTYTLSGLLRGREGTEQFVSTHAIGDPFVLMNSAVKRVPLSTSDIGLNLQFKAVTFGQRVVDAPSWAINFQSVGQKPLSPVQIGMGRTASSSYDINMKWYRRARVNTAWRSSVDVPLDETTEAYEVDVYSTSSYTTVLRTITSTATAAGSVVTPSTQTAVYKSADQVTDFGSNQATVYVKVYQVSAIVGRGFALTGSG
jgi:hypothetical protein